MVPALRGRDKELFGAVCLDHRGLLVLQLADLRLAHQVALRRDEEDDAVSDLLPDLVDPVGDRLLRRLVEAHERDIRIPIEHAADRLEPLLAGRVPDVELDLRVVLERDRRGAECGRDRRLRVRLVRLLEERVDERRFTDAARADEDHLERAASLVRCGVH